MNQRTAQPEAAKKMKHLLAEKVAVRKKKKKVFIDKKQQKTLQTHTDKIRVNPFKLRLLSASDGRRDSANRQLHSH